MWTALDFSTEGVEEDANAGSSVAGSSAADVPNGNASAEDQEFNFDFDILDPPLNPIIPDPPAGAPIVTWDQVNTADVMLGNVRRANAIEKVENQNKHYMRLLDRFVSMVQWVNQEGLRTKLSRSVVLIVRQRGGRFLRTVDGRNIAYEGNDRFGEVGDEKAAVAVLNKIMRVIIKHNSAAENVCHLDNLVSAKDAFDFDILNPPVQPKMPPDSTLVSKLNLNGNDVVVTKAMRGLEYSNPKYDTLLLQFAKAQRYLQTRPASEERVCSIDCVHCSKSGRTLPWTDHTRSRQTCRNLF